MVTDLKVSIGSTGLVRTVNMGPDAAGHTAIIGHTSGFISILDLRMGKLRQAWKAHEGEILNIMNLSHAGGSYAANVFSTSSGSSAAQSSVGSSSAEFISTSLDQTVSVWSANDGRLKTSLPGKFLTYFSVRYCQSLRSLCSSRL